MAEDPVRHEPDRTDFDGFRNLIRELRGENGCPWDRRQTLASLKKYLREEADEAIAEIEKGSDEGLCEELGDVLLIVQLLIQVAEEEGRFTFDDVVRGISEKIVRRHPHVFGGLEVKSEKEIIANWHRIKEEEKRGRNRA